MRASTYDELAATIVFSRVPHAMNDRNNLRRAFEKNFNVPLELHEMPRGTMVFVVSRSQAESARLRMRGYIDGWCDARGV